jgi:thiol-disulfide isomerase/thioredoxin
MAATASSMVALGTPAPDFALIDTRTSAIRSRDELKGDSGTVIMFICNHCPYVKHVNAQLVAVAREYQSKGISFVAISSNDAIAYPQDGPEAMKQTAVELGYPFPYLYD